MLPPFHKTNNQYNAFFAFVNRFVLLSDNNVLQNILQHELQ